MGYTPEFERESLDRDFPTTASTDHVAWSTNGTSETSLVPRTAIGATGWAAAVTPTPGQPSRKPTSGLVTSAGATGAGTITHAAIFSAASGGTQKTTWEPLLTSVPVTEGGRIEIQAGALAVTKD